MKCGHSVIYCYQLNKLYSKCHISYCVKMKQNALDDEKRLVLYACPVMQKSVLKGLWIIYDHTMKTHLKKK